MPPNKDNELCQNCGYTYRTHQPVMGGPIAEPITCPTASKNTTDPLFIFVESGWYDGTPQEPGFGYMLMEHEVVVNFVGYWDKQNGPCSVRYFPLVSPPKLVPMPKGKVNAT